MITLRDSLVSSSARRLPIRHRADLSARRQQYQGRTFWVVKEPLGLNYFRFHEEEFAILEMLDGETSLDEIKERFEEQFPPQKITLEELQQFLGMLHRSGLVTVDAPGQGRQLHKRRGERRRREWMAALGNVLCIRFKGIDPERLLQWLYPKVGWFFAWPTAIACLILALSALTLVTVEFDVFRSKLPGFHEFFTAENAFWLALTLGVTKVLHEFGHGLMCKHFGGECHEMGVMFLVLTPCLYCNVSDSWMLPSKWQRAAIGAAGMYVEVVLAAICTFVWWFSEPGLLHYLCLNVMFISSVSTIIFNANPLLRYDGYYILADLMEIPNLRQKASSILNRKMGEWLLGIEPPDDPFLPDQRQVFFALYAVASGVYRWVVLASILWFLYHVFKPYGLEAIGQTIAAVSIISLVVMPLYKLGKFFYVPGRIEKVKKPRMYASLAVVTALLAGVLLVPLPFSVLSSLEVQPRDANPVYIDVFDGGRLEKIFVRPGDRVEAGQPLAQLSNLQLEAEIAALAGEREQYVARIDSLTKMQYIDSRVGNSIPPLEKALASVEDKLRRRERDRERLLLRAPEAGTVLPPPEKMVPDDPDGQLPPWSGTPFDEKNLGAWLEEGELFCLVGDPQDFEAVFVIDQTDVEMVREQLARVGRPDALAAAVRAAAEGHGPAVDIQLDQLPGHTYRSHITDVAAAEMRVTPRRLSARAGGDLASTVDPVTGRERPQSTSYQASAPLEDADGLLRVGLTGEGRIYLDWLPLGSRLWRFAMHTFNFRM
ncbi:MAG: site-2 protease family protein [Planctomycetota bacterium]